MSVKESSPMSKLISPLASDLEYVPCNCCGADDMRLLATAAEKWRELEYRIVQCKKCRLIYVNPRRKGGLINDDNCNWDEALDYFRSKESDRRRSARNILDILALAGCSQGDLLEIGSGMGMLLLEARSHGWNVTGVEINRQLATYCDERGLNVTNDSIDSAIVPDSSYDVVVMTQVLEHLLDPKGCLGIIYRVLRPGGCVYLGIPQVDKRVLRKARTDREFARALWRPEAHLYYFLPTVIRRMLGDTGFHELPIPMLGSMPRRWIRKIKAGVRDRLLHASPGVFIARKPLETKDRVELKVQHHAI